MAKWHDSAIEVQAVTNDTIKIRYGGSGMEVPKERLKTLMEGTGDISPADMLLCNIAARLALSAVSIEDDVAIKREVERVAFKICE